MADLQLIAGNQRPYHKRCLSTKDDMDDDPLKALSNGGGLQERTVSRSLMMCVSTSHMSAYLTGLISSTIRSTGISNLSLHSRPNCSDKDEISSQ